MSNPSVNPNAHVPMSLDYSAHRRFYIRAHTRCDHHNDDHPVVIRIPPHVPGVKP